MLSLDGKTLYVTNGNTNNVAVVDVTKGVKGPIPTGLYPQLVAVSRTGAYLYIVNGKSPSGPNPRHCKGGSVAQPQLTAAVCNASNPYTSQTIKAGLQVVPLPNAVKLSRLTMQVAGNYDYAGMESRATRAKMDFLASQIHHVVYIIKKNRTCNQILGDLVPAT